MVTSAHGGCVNEGLFKGQFRPFAGFASATVQKIRRILEEDGRLTNLFSVDDIAQLKRFFNASAVKHYRATQGVIAKTHSPKDEEWLVPGYLKAVDRLSLPEIIQMDDRRQLMGLMAFFQEMANLAVIEITARRAREHSGVCGTLSSSRRNRRW